MKSDEKYEKKRENIFFDVIRLEIIADEVRTAEEGMEKQILSREFLRKC